jgi:2-oxoglutarate decarboxylase
VAQSPNGQSGNQSSVAPSSDLGANEWLVEEMKEQYDKDPASVGPEWASYFGNGSASPAPTAQK